MRIDGTQWVVLNLGDGLHVTLPVYDIFNLINSLGNSIFIHCSNFAFFFLYTVWFIFLYSLCSFHFWCGNGMEFWYIFFKQLKTFFTSDPLLFMDLKPKIIDKYFLKSIWISRNTVAFDQLAEFKNKIHIHNAVQRISYFINNFVSKSFEMVGWFFSIGWKWK